MAPFLRQSIPFEPKEEPAERHETTLALCGEPGRCFPQLRSGGPGTGAGIGFLVLNWVPLQFLAESNDHVLGSHFVHFNVLRSQEPARKGKEETRAAQRSADSQPAKNECAREEARTCFPTHAQPKRNAPAGVFSSPATSPCTSRGAHSHTSFVCAETSLFYSRASPSDFRERLLLPSRGRE